MADALTIIKTTIKDYNPNDLAAETVAKDILSALDAAGLLIVPDFDHREMRFSQRNKFAEAVRAEIARLDERQQARGEPPVDRVWIALFAASRVARSLSPANAAPP